MKDLDNFQKNIDYTFKNIKLLEIVFTHRSYLNEHRTLKLEHNERMEFLGDAVLELCVTEYLYKNYVNPEGIMTNWRSAVVKGESLSEEAKRLSMNNLIMTSRGEAKNTGKARDLILANAFESLIGAIYLDKGYIAAYDFVEKNVLYKLNDIVKQGLFYDSKSRFQESSQETLGITPTYELTSESGPDHNKIFIMGAYLNEKKVGEGQGASKQKAQSEAATDVLKNWDTILKEYK